MHKGDAVWVFESTGSTQKYLHEVPRLHQFQNQAHSFSSLTLLGNVWCTKLHRVLQKNNGILKHADMKCLLSTLSSISSQLYHVVGQFQVRDFVVYYYYYYYYYYYCFVIIVIAIIVIIIIIIELKNDVGSGLQHVVSLHLLSMSPLPFPKYAFRPQQCLFLDQFNRSDHISDPQVVFQPN